MSRHTLLVVAILLLVGCVEPTVEEPGRQVKILASEPPKITPATTVPQAPKQAYLKVGHSEQFAYWGHNIEINYTSAEPKQIVEVEVDGALRSLEKELTDSPDGIYWKVGNLSFTLKPVTWEMRDGRRIPFYEKTWNTTELYFEVVISGVDLTGGDEGQLRVVR